jgi:hypothetical protein
LEARYVAHFECVDGGVAAFTDRPLTDDHQSLLIISKALYGQYAERLAGSALLQDQDDYMVFGSE